jgi:hypothetical protein
VRVLKMQQKLYKSKRVHKKQWSKMIYPNLAFKFFWQLDPLYYDVRRRYSYRDISELMLKEYGVKIHYSTICRWAHRLRWLELWDYEIMRGLMEAMEKLEKDEDYQRFIRQVYEDYKRLSKGG